MLATLCHVLRSTEQTVYLLERQVTWNYNILFFQYSQKKFNRKKSTTQPYVKILSNKPYFSPITGLDRPLGFQEFEDPVIYRQSTYEDGKVGSPTHWPPLPIENIPGTHFG
jgi:hypothetical protein